LPESTITKQHWAYHRYWRWTALTASVAVMAILYGPILVAPDHFLFDGGGDAVKNYFTFAWHVRYDTNWLHFGGSNYPYGEHVCFTDGHPILSLLLGWIPWVKQYPVGTLNLILLLSQIVGVYVIYELLLKFKCMPFLAALGACSMVWLQPNMFRVLGHLSLSHVWVIPLAFLFVVRIWEDASIRVSSLLFMYLLIIFLLHPYYGMMISLLPFCMGFLGLVWNGVQKKWDRKYLYYLLVGILAPLCYLLFIKLTDIHLNRPEKSVGFLTYTSGIENILVPALPPFHHLMSQIIKVKGQQWEGAAYVGVASIFISFCYIIVSILKWQRVNLRNSSIWNVLFPASSIILAFSFGFPFYLNLEWLLEKLPFIEQFRAPGRFAWIFYFTLVPFAFVQLSCFTDFLNKRYNSFWPFLIPIICFGLFIAEGWIAQNGTADKAQKNVNFLTRNDQFNISPVIQTNDFKESTAIVTFPFFHYGTEYFYLGCSDKTRNIAYSAAMLSGKPLVCSSNPRVSFNETFNILSLFSPDYARRKVLNDFPKNTRLFVLNTDSLPDYQNNSYLKTNQKIIDIEEEIAECNHLMNVLKSNSDQVLLAELNHAQNDSFEVIRTMRFNPLKRMANALDNIDLTVLKPKSLTAGAFYEASVFIYSEQLHLLKTSLCFEEVGKSKSDQVAVNSYESFHIYGDSALLTLHFSPKDSTSEYRLRLIPSQENKQNYTYGDLQIRKRNEVLIERDSILNHAPIVRINHFFIPWP
jgi:hypothetical protein